MTRRAVALLSILLGVVGCSTAPARFYTLDAAAVPDGAPPAGYAVAVGPVTMPASVSRPQFVIQVAPNRVAVDEFNRWAAPLDDAVAHAVASNLAVLLGTPRVAVAPLVNFAPTYRVAVAVQTFESVPGEAVRLEAVWSIRQSAGGEPRSGRTVAREVPHDASFDALAAAHSRALAQMSADIAAAIRAEAAVVPPARRVR
jgi:hypothetical protein